MTIGLYDPNNEITEQVKALVNDDLVVVSSFMSGKAEQVDPRQMHLANKQLLLERTTHVIIQIADMESLSMLTGALRRLLEGTLTGVMAVGPVPLEHLYSSARYDGTEATLHEYVQNKKFAITDKFDPSLLKTFLTTQ